MKLLVMFLILGLMMLIVSVVICKVGCDNLCRICIVGCKVRFLGIVERIKCIKYCKIIFKFCERGCEINKFILLSI